MTTYDPAEREVAQTDAAQTDAARRTEPLDELVGWAVLEHVPFGNKGASFVSLVRMFQTDKRVEALRSAQRQRDLKPGRLIAVAEVRLAENWK